MKTSMNAEPALVERTSPSLKFRKNCTAHETSEPKVAVAIIHGLVVVVVATLVVDVAVVVMGMMSITCVEAVSVPDAPDTAMVVVPPDAPPETAMLSVEVALSPAGGITGFVLKMAVTPAGSVGTASVTGELKPPMDCTVTMTVPTPPGLRVRVLGLDDMVKYGAVVADVVVVVVVVVGVTVNVLVAESLEPRFDIASTV